MSINEIVDTMNEMSEHARLHEAVRYYFYQADDNATALQLAKEALSKGYNSPLYNYVIGFCFNNGAAVPLNKRMAGQYFKAAADCMDADGNLLQDKYADESRIILAEDFVFSSPEYCGLDTESVIRYCEAAILFGTYADDARLYLAKLYGRSEYGCHNPELAMKYLNMLIQSSNPKIRFEANELYREVKNGNKRKKSSIFSRWF